MASTDKSLAVYVGMQVDLNGRELTLAPKTPINQVSKHGLELELPDNVFLGKVGKTADGLINSFLPDNPKKNKFKIDELTTGIEAVDGIINKIKEAELSLSKFHLKIPSKSQANAEDQDPTEYTVALAATWSDIPEEQKENMGGFEVTLKGLVVMFTNETQEGLDQIKMIKEATAEAQKVLAPGRDLEALKLKTKQELQYKLDKAKEDEANSQAVVDQMQAVEDQVKEIKNDDNITGDKEALTTVSKNAEKLREKANSSLDKAKRTIDEANDLIGKLLNISESEKMLERSRTIESESEDKINLIMADAQNNSQMTIEKLKTEVKDAEAKVEDAETKAKKAASEKPEEAASVTSKVAEIRAEIIKIKDLKKTTKLSTLKKKSYDLGQLITELTTLTGKL
jgi:hypothetical protein